MFEPHAPYGNPADHGSPLDRYDNEIGVADREIGGSLSVDIQGCLAALAPATTDPSFDIFICENGGKDAFYSLKDILLSQGLCDICADGMRHSAKCTGDKFTELVCLVLKGRSSRVWIACASRNLGYAGAVNAWIEKLEIVTDWGGLWILNPDTEPHPDALAELV